MSDGNKSRKVRTLAERKAAAQREAVRVEQLAIKQATALLEQATGWETRSIELAAKAAGAREKARGLLIDVDIEPEGFFNEFEADAEEVE